MVGSSPQKVCKESGAQKGLSALRLNDVIGLFRSKYKIKTPRCSVKIRRKPREAREFRDYLEIVEVEYSDAKQSCVFSGAWARNEKATQQIILAVPHSLPESDHADVLANLGEALEKLGYEF